MSVEHGVRILHAVRSLSSAVGGPVEAIRQMSTALANLGHQVEVASLDPPQSPGSAKGSAKDFPFPVHALGGNAKPLAENYGFSKTFIPWLRENRSKYDAVISHGLWQYNNVAVWESLRGSGIPYFVFPHGMLDPWTRKAYPLKHIKKLIYWLMVERRVLRGASGVLFTCEEERLLSRRTFGSADLNERVVSLGIASPDLQRADQQRDTFFRAYPGLEGKQLVLFLGRLHEKKGCDLLLEAFGQMSARLRGNHHLVFAGGWSDRAYEQRIKLKVSELAPNSVTFTGMLEGDLKWGAFHASEVFILPSHQENFGIAIVEALACGLPVLISNKVNIWREISSDGAGFVESDDVSGTLGLLDRWSRLSEAGRSDMRRAARECYMRRFQSEGTARQLLALIDRGQGRTFRNSRANSSTR